MTRRKWALATIFLLLSGCRSTSILIGVREPDIIKIQLGDQRSQVEKILGKRLWRPGLSDGLTYDIYQYALARPAQPALGTAGLFLDYITLGMLEAELADVPEFEHVKQVSVAYDGQDRVRFISQPWLVTRAGPCRRMRVVIPADSGVPPAARPLLVADQSGSPSEVATMELDNQIHVEIDGRQVEGRVVELSAGRHTLNYDANLGGSIMYGSMSLSYKNTFADFELLSGRTYQLKMDRFYPGAGNRVDIFWVEDTDSGETLKCSW
jgi:hypothetical protein